MRVCMQHLVIRARQRHACSNNNVKMLNFFLPRAKKRTVFNDGNRNELACVYVHATKCELSSIQYAVSFSFFLLFFFSIFCGPTCVYAGKKEKKHE